MSYGVYLDNNGGLTIIHDLENINNEDVIIVNDDFPKPDIKQGKNAVMKFDQDKQIVYFDYEDRPLTPDEQTKVQLDEQKKQISQLLLTNAQLTQDNLTTKKQNADILMKLAKNNIN